MSDLGYNVGNENASDEWSTSLNGEEVTGKVVERIEKKNLVQLTRPECEHKNVTYRLADEFEAEVTEVDCQDCPLGWYINGKVNRS